MRKWPILAKIPQCFSPEKFNATHSLVLGKLCIFFFSAFLEKKKYRCISFFPRNSLKATHSAERQLPLRKRYFCTFSVYFFFQQKCVFFFPWNSLPATHSLVLKGRKKKNTAAEKKNTAFHSLTRFFPKRVKK